MPPLSRHFSLDDLCHAGETWRRLADLAQARGEGMPVNLPLQPESLASLAGLAIGILDRVVDRFGAIEITYGFASPSLTRHVDGRIRPKLDQHAASEVGKRGPVCDRRGAAVDFRVPGLSSRELARFVVADLPWDRLYFYGDDRPIHVSWHPVPAHVYVEMRRGPSGRLVPCQRPIASL